MIQFSLEYKKYHFQKELSQRMILLFVLKMKTEIYLDSNLSSHELAASFMNSSTFFAAVKKTLYTIYLIRKLDHLQICNC